MVELGALIEKWKGQIGQEWVYPTSLNEIFSQDIIIVPGWNEEVEKGTVKKWAIVNRDLNALWLDEEYARKSRWGGIIAPPLFLFSVTEGLRFPPYLADEAEKQGIHFDHLVNAGCQWEFFEPVRPGDKISFKTILADVYEKQGKRGKLVFIVDETTYTNQKGQIAATNRGTVIMVRESKLGEPSSAT